MTIYSPENFMKIDATDLEKSFAQNQQEKEKIRIEKKKQYNNN